MFGICINYPFAYEDLKAIVHREFADVKPCGAIGILNGEWY